MVLKYSKLVEILVDSLHSVENNTTIKVGLTSIERNGVVQNLTQKMGEQK